MSDLVLSTSDSSYKESPQSSAPFTQDNYLSIQFNYKDGNNTWPGKDSLSMIITGESKNSKRFYNLRPNTSKSFRQDGLIFYGDTKINYQFVRNKLLAKYLFVEKPDGISVPLQINPIDKAMYLPPSNIPAKVLVTIDTSFTNTSVAAFNKKTILKEVVVKSRFQNAETQRLAEIDKQYTSGMFSGLTRGYQVNVLDDPEAATAPNLYTYIIYKVPGLVTYTDAADHLKKFIQARSYMLREYKPVTLYLDERMMYYDQLDGLYVSNVAYVKYIPGIVIGSAEVTTDGALYIYTKKGTEASTGTSMLSVTLKGYDQPASFKLPDYKEKANLLNPDRRSSLYWNPYIFTDKNNNRIRLEYYNNDFSKRHLVVLEGVNEDGKLVHVEKILE